MVLILNGSSNNKARHILKRASHCVTLTASCLIKVIMQKQLFNGNQIVMSDVEDTDQTFLNETDPCASTEHQEQWLVEMRF